MVRERKAEAVLSSARALFLDKGFASTTVDEIADAAHVSKATVYSNFTDKSAVLTALLERVTTEAAEVLAPLGELLEGPGAVDQRIEAAAVALLGGVLRAEVLQLRRLAITESARFPAEVGQYFERGPASTVRLLGRAFRVMDADGELTISDPDQAAARFAYALVGPAQDRALLTGWQPKPRELRRLAWAATQEFVAAHRPHPR